MTKNLSRRIFLLSLLYIGILFGIFALQFTSGNAFSMSVGLLRVSGATGTDANGDSVPVLPVHIAGNGVDFFVDDQNPLMAYTTETSGFPLRVIGVTGPNDPNRFKITFSEGVSVSFVSERRGDSDIVSIAASIPAKYQKIVLPYKITRSARIEKKDSLTLISTGKNKFIFNGAHIQAPVSSGAYPLSIQRAVPVVYYQSYIPAKGLVIAELSSIAGGSSAAYSSAREHFASVALESFKKTVEAGQFSEPVVAAYIAEMGRIGMYHTAIESIPDSWRNGSGRSYLTNVYLNNLEKTYPGLVKRERDDRTDISRKLADNDPSCFAFPSLVPYLVDRGSSILLKDLARVASSVDMANVTSLQAAGILESMMDFGIYRPGEENPLLPLADSCERKIKASLVRMQDNLYVSDDGKAISTADSLRVAQVLIKYGAASEPGWTAAGHLIVTSLVSFAGDRASLPAAFSIEGSGENAGIVAKSDKMLDPASLFPLVLSGETWYPHALSLATQAEPGVWAWTCAQSIKISKPSEGSMKITTRFSQGETHYMVLRGIKPFNRIQIYGMDFRTDPRFESYNSSGYRYNEETGTLYLKMRHKSEYEDVVIWFGATAKPELSVPGDSSEAGESAETNAQP